MWQEAGCFIGIKKASSFIEGEDFINRKSVHLHAVGFIHICQLRQAVDDFLVSRINRHMILPDSRSVPLASLPIPNWRAARSLPFKKREPGTERSPGGSIPHH